ncbi:metallophosphoesterase family protein [Chlamydiota bacterium]
MRIAHLSDPHFSHFTLNPNQFLSKRWMGNFNFQLFRKGGYQTEHLWHLPELLASLNVDRVFITGDFSSTSLDEEFEEGKRFVQAFQEKGLPTYTLPGNHDCYTSKAQLSKRFYDFFPSPILREKRVECLPLQKGWWYVGLDCAVAAPLFCAYGRFFEETEHYLVEALSKIPPSDRVILCNHFPLFPAGRSLHDLKRGDLLQKTVQQFPQIQLYLHGHDHHHYIVDRQAEGFPLTLNRGSCAHSTNGTFYIIDLSENECLIQQLLYTQEGNKPAWNINWQKHYTLKA